MSGVRPPAIAGAGGGVGTTTLAVALHGRDAGFVPDGADILACRARPDSLRRAAAALDRIGPGPRPVLAVTLDGARAPRGPVRVHLDQLASAVSAVVLLPDVGRWRRTVDPLPEAATLLVEPVERVPRPLRAYAAALRELATAVAASGRLEVTPTGVGRPVAPPPGAGRRGAPATGTGRPVARPALVGDVPAGQAPGPTGLHRAWPEQARSASRPGATAATGGTAARNAPAGNGPGDDVAIGDRPTGTAPVGDAPAGKPPTGRTPRVVGAFQPVVGTVTVFGPGPRTAGPRRPSTWPEAVRVEPRRPDSPDATAAPGAEPRRRRGVRIVSPPPSRPVGPPLPRSATPPPGEPARPPAARAVQVG